MSKTRDDDEICFVHSFQIVLPYKINEQIKSKEMRNVSGEIIVGQ